jgi:hypothetical protein
MANRHRAVYAALFLFLGMTLAAQEAAGEEIPDNETSAPFFPIHRLWQDAQGGGLRWQPDWPLVIPPDSFDPVANGPAFRVTITVTAVSDETTATGTSAENPPDPAAEPPVSDLKYTARLDQDRRLVEFPFLVNGGFCQTFVQYNRLGLIETMTLALSAEESAEAPVEITFLQMNENRPVTARIKADGTYYFASFRWTADSCVELWTDETGTPLEIFHDDRIRHYDNMQNTTFISDSLTETSAVYTAAGVRYWTTADRELSFQRDETGLLVRLTGTQKSAQKLNYSYEYQLDPNGNWTDRREIRWIEIKDYLAPTQGTLVTRHIDYAPQPE